MESIYQTVPLSGRRIRLINVLVALPDSPISYELLTTYLDSPVPYTSVSYTWGDPNPSHTILLNGHPFQVGENLCSLLQQISTSHRGPYWIDAICIDQSSNTERTQQVSLMGEIYSKASKVLVWLGRGTNDILRGMQILQPVSKSWRFEVLERAESSFAEPALELCRLPYWTRVWIVQEFVLAKQLEIRVGDQVMDGKNMEWLFKHLRKESRSAYDQRLLLQQLWQTPAIQIIHQRVSWHEWSKETSGMSFTALVNTFGRLECMDARDRVYGLLSLVDPAELEKLDLRPDYEKTEEELLDEVMGKIRRVAVHMDDAMVDEYALYLRELLRLKPEGEQTRRRIPDVPETMDDGDIEEIMAEY